MKQMKISIPGEKKVIDLDDFFTHLKTGGTTEGTSGVFRALAYVYRATLIRANSIAEVPYAIFQGNREITGYPQPLTNLFYTIECDLCLYGAAYILKRNGGEKLQRLNPGAMSIEADSAHGIKVFKFSTGSTVKNYAPKEIIYLHYYDPTNDLGGVSPTQVALAAANLGINASAFASAFFSHAAIPAVVFEVPGVVSEAEQERVRGVWDKLFGGVKSAFRTAVLGEGMHATVLGSDLKDVAMPELMAEVRKQIAVAFGICEDLLTTEAANFATATAHATQYFHNTVVPEVRLIEGAFNEQYFAGTIYDLRFKTEMTAESSEEEKDRSMAVNAYVRSGVPLETALAILGVYVPAGMSIEPTASPLMVTGAKPGEEFKSRAELLRTGPWADDLKLWEKKAMRVFKETGSAHCTFWSPYMPWQLGLEIMAALDRCRSELHIKLIFEGVGIE